MTTYIRDWEDLKNITQESETHILKLGTYNAWLKAKNEKPYNPDLDYLDQAKYLDVYLSTHTFYDENKEWSTKLFKACGFNIEIK